MTACPVFLKTEKQNRVGQVPAYALATFQSVQADNAGSLTCCVQAFRISAANYVTVSCTVQLHSGL